MKKYSEPKINIFDLQDISVLHVSIGVDEGQDYIEDNYGW